MTGHAVLRRARRRPGSRPSPWSSPGRTPTWELVSVDSMQVYRGMDIGTAKPTAAEQAEVPPPPARPARPVGGRHRRLVPAAGARAPSPTSSSRGRRALLVGGTGALRAGRRRRPRRSPGSTPTCAPILEADARHAPRLHAQLAELDPVAAGRMEPTNRRRIVRALEVTIGSGRPFSSYGPGLDAHPPTAVHHGRAPARRRRARARGSRPATPRRWTPGSSTRCGACAPSPAGCRAPPARRSATRSCSTHLDGAATLDEALDLAIRRTGRFARRQRAWFRRDPRITWLDAVAPTATP